MKNIYFISHVFILFCVVKLNGQCGANYTLGSSSNFFTNIRNATNPIAVNKDLNMVAFVHRNESSFFGGNSGHLRYDVSTNAGITWTNNLGVLNSTLTNLARYPNMAIYNPINNLNPNNAYVSYLAATIDPLSSLWNGVVSGVSQISGAGTTESYNQPIIAPNLIPHAMVKGAPGVMWSVDALYNGATINGLAVYKGIWNSNINDFVWTTNFTVTPPFNLAYTGAVYIADYNIAFDPTGQIGYISFLSHITPGPSNYAYYPILYKTTNGGVSWSGPTQVNLNNFSCMTSNLGTNNVVSCGFEHDLAVDVNGNPHVFVSVGNGTNAYSMSFNLWHHMFDITTKNGIWIAYDIADVRAGRGTWTSSQSMTQDFAPQIARTTDGGKIFYTWTDNSNYTLGAANQSPNLFARGLNVLTSLLTPSVDFSSCDITANGKIIAPHTAEEVLEPSLNTYKLATVYGEFSTTALDPLLTTNFKFLDNITFTSAQFSITPPTASVTIAQAPLAIVCPNSTLIINLQGPHGADAIWSNSAIGNTISVFNPTVTTYSVIAQQNCQLGTATVSVTNLSVNMGTPPPATCIGNTVNLIAAGNALGYTWTPGALTGTNVTATLGANNNYTLSALGSNACMYQQTLTIPILTVAPIAVSSISVCLGDNALLSASGAVTYTWSGTGGNNATANYTPTTTDTYSVYGTTLANCSTSNVATIFVSPVPTVVLTAPAQTVCEHDNLVLTSGGAITYTWSDGSTGLSATITPTSSTIYTVTGTDINGCTGTNSILITTLTSPTVSVFANPPVVCAGNQVLLNANGAVFYLWNEGSTSSFIAINPTITTNYTVQGFNTNNCIHTNTVTVTVNPLPTLSVTSTRSVFCVGEKGTLTVNGAATYSWNTGSLLPTTTITPKNNTVLLVTGTDALGCSKTTSVAITTNPCLSIQENTFSDDFSIYPNPNNGSFFIRSSVKDNVAVFNALGQLLLDKTLDPEKNNTIEVENLPIGIYFIISKTSKRTKKIIVQ